VRASLEWLREYAALDAPVEQLVRVLGETGTEVERVVHAAEGAIVARVTQLTDIRESTRGVRLADIDVGASDPVRVLTGAPNVTAGDLVAYGPPGTLLPGRTEPLEVRSMFGGRYQSPGMLLSAVELGVGDDAGGLLILDRGRPGQPLHEALRDLDVLLDLAVTTNRPDCLCHVGIARELSAALGEALHEPSVDIADAFLSATSTARRVRARIDDPGACHRMTLRVIEGVTVTDSPGWLARRISSIGLRPINNVVDITNYVTHELGHPLHAFDLERFATLAGGDRPATLTVRRARAGETLECLDRRVRDLGPADLVIAAGDVPASLAGVIGGTATAVDGRTTAVLLEAAAWEPTTVRATARRQAARTDASALFDKGLSDQLSPLALDRAAGLIAEIAGGHVLRDPVDERPSPLPAPPAITVDGEWLRALLGAAVDPDEAATALVRLGFAVEHDGSRLTVVPPYFRRDVGIREDVAEEVGRSLGYDRVPATLPGRRVAVSHLASEPPVEDHVRDVCVGAGFDEVIPYVFVRPETAASLPGLGEGRTPMLLVNPISDQMTHLRTSLLPGLCETLALNLRRSVEDAAIFELGRVFWEGERQEPPAGALPDGADRDLPPLPAEPLLLATAVHVEDDAEVAAAALRRCQALADWLLADLGAGPAVALPAVIPSLHPARAARVSTASGVVGLLGELDPETMARFELRGRVVVAELRLDTLVAGARRPSRYVPVPHLPAVVQDLAVSVPRESRAGDALTAVRAAAGPLLESVQLRDEFLGEQVGPERKGWTFRLTFRSPERTLTSEEVQGWHDAVLAALTGRCAARLRE
jgi:phenylalanyl-tRNA synthetase beta chain